MRTPLRAGLFAAALLSAPGHTQDFTEGWEFDGKAQLVTVISSFDDVERLPAETILGEISVRATAEKTLDNSAEIGFRLEMKAQKDNPARAGFSGNIAPFEPVIGPTPQGSYEPVRGAYTGLTRFGPVEDAGFNGAIETAQFYVDGGYGQVSAGYGRGVAARFHEGAPDIFSHARAVNPKLDPAGLNLVRTENDLTGPAAKISYQTPRLIGIRAGISYTPEANVAGVDRDPRRSVPGVATPEISDVVEGAVQFSRKFTEQDLRVRASANYALGSVSAPISSAEIDDVLVWSAGVEFEFDTLSFGGEYLNSNNGLARNGDYSAWSLGITKDAFGWEWGAQYGESDDENINARAQNWSFGGATKISHNVKLAAGYQHLDVDFGQLPFNITDSASNSAPEGVVVEITLSH